MPAPSIESVAADAWPSLPLDRWRDTYDTLHLWTQLAGKLALALSPLTNHYWNTALQITPRGLATLPLTVDRRAVTVAFDFVAHQLTVACSDGRHDAVPLAPRPVAEFYRRVVARRRRRADSGARGLCLCLSRAARLPRCRHRPGRRELRSADARVDPALRGGAARPGSGCRAPRVCAEHLPGGGGLRGMGAGAARALAGRVPGDPRRPFHVRVAKLGRRAA